MEAKNLLEFEEVTLVDQIIVNTKLSGKPLYPMWRKCVGAGRANEGLRANWLEQLELAVKSCGFEYIRFHGLLHDDMCLFRIIDGVPVYNWQYVDELFDRLLEIGIRPFVEFGFCPIDMASGIETQFWWKGNITPPSNLKDWANLIEKLVEHWRDRYGIDEIRKWYYEVWNEPNLSAFWTGTRSQYFELYKTTVMAVKKVDSKLRVGGPATSNFVPDDRFEGEREDVSRHLTFRMENVDETNWRPVWVAEFLAYCEQEVLPVDFVSTHPYPTDFALDGYGKTEGFSRTVHSTRNDLFVLRQIVSESAYPQAEIHLSEWSSSPSPRDHSHDHLPAAAFVVKANLDATPLADSLSYWVFSDVFEEGGAGASIFHGGFGLINFQGIAKPTFHAYRLLNQLGDEELLRKEKVIITRKSEDGSIRALFYHYDDQSVPSAVPLAATQEKALDIQRKGTASHVGIHLTALEPFASFELEHINETSGYAVPAWIGMGNPEPPNRQQTIELREKAEFTEKYVVRASEQGELIIQINLAPWELVSLTQIIK